MKYSLLALAITLTSGAALADVAKVEQFNIDVTKADYVPYQGAFAERFPGGLGENLAFCGVSEVGDFVQTQVFIFVPPRVEPDLCLCACPSYSS